MSILLPIDEWHTFNTKEQRNEAIRCIVTVKVINDTRFTSFVYLLPLDNFNSRRKNGRENKLKKSLMRK
jgi:hypothetical protein